MDNAVLQLLLSEQDTVEFVEIFSCSFIYNKGSLVQNLKHEVWFVSSSPRSVSEREEWSGDTLRATLAQ